MLVGLFALLASRNVRLRAVADIQFSGHSAAQLGAKMKDRSL